MRLCLILIFFMVPQAAGTCLSPKLCCNVEMGRLDCIKKCSDEYCPMSYPIEIGQDDKEE